MSSPIRRVCAGTGAALLIAMTVLAVQAWQAGRHLEAIQARLPALRQTVLQQDAAAARQQLRSMARDASAARAETTGGLWWAAERVPFLGRTPASLAGIAQSVDGVVAAVLPALARATSELNLARLHPVPGRLDLTVLSAARPEVDAALRALAPLIGPPPQAGVLRWVGRPEREMRSRLLGLQTGLRHADDALRLLPDVLGGGRRRRYFIAFQGSAEARGTGGLVGAYGILQAEGGRLEFQQLGDDRALVDQTGLDIGLGADFTHLYGRDPELWSNTNLSPNFPYAARLWLAMWKAQTGEQLDGVLATDTTGLADLLTSVGPVTVAGGQRVTGANVVALTERDVYVRFAGREPARKDFLVTIARAVADELLGGSGSAADRVTGLRRAAADGRLLLYSARPAEQLAMAGSRITGEIPEDRAPYAAVVVNNAAGNKLDYYLHRRVDYVLGPCRSNRRSTSVHVTLHNAVPDGPLPMYVSGRSDLPVSQTSQRGSTKLYVGLYATTGAGLTRATLDGVRVPVTAGVERGHPVYLLPVTLERGQRREIVFDLVEPAAAGAVRTPVQPLVTPQQTTVHEVRCAGH